MILTGAQIDKEVREGSIVLSDYHEKRLNPNSYNLRLGSRLLAYANPILDTEIENPTTCRQYNIGDQITLFPNQLYLAETMEWTETHNHIPMIEGRSSFGRLGLFVHVTAGFGDIGFKGRWTLEICCLKPIRLRIGCEICQIFYHQPFGDITSRYNGRYQNAKSVEPSKIHHR